MKPSPPPYELAVFTEGVVSKYGFISVDGNRYSVPEDFVGKRMTVKKYYDELRICFNFAEVAIHRRCYDKGVDIVDISHFLKAFDKKPGSLENSVADLIIKIKETMSLNQISKLKNKFEL